MNTSSQPFYIKSIFSHLEHTITKHPPKLCTNKHLVASIKGIFASRVADALLPTPLRLTYFEAIYFFICGHRREAVARYRMICLVLTYFAH